MFALESNSSYYINVVSPFRTFFIPPLCFVHFRPLIESFLDEGLPDYVLCAIAVLRSALLNVLKVLKLLLVSSAYASIFKVVLEMKQDAKSVSEERHSMAKQLQTALEQILPSADHKLKNVSMNLAKLYVEKVSTVMHIHGLRHT